MMLAPLLYTAAQSGSSIDIDARLAASVTIEVPIITLKELAAQLTKETGVPLKVADSIRDRKATLFVKDRSARETMDALADTFFLDWLPDGKGYRVTLAKGIADEEAEAVRTDREKMKSKIDDTFSGWRELDSMSPEEQAQEQSSLSTERKALAGKLDQASIDRLTAIDRRLHLSSQGAWTSFAVAYKGLESQAEDALINGRTLYASSRPGDDCPRLGESLSRKHLPPYEAAIAVMLVNRASCRLQGKFLFLGERSVMGSPAGGPLLPEDESSYRIAKRLAGWSIPADATVAGLPLRRTTAPNVRLITLADQLAYLHQRTEAPIVADAYRVPCPGGGQTGETVGDFAQRLTEFSKLRFAPGAVAFRMARGWLEGRHLRYWRLEPREPKEEVLQPVEDAATHGKQPSTELYAKLAAGLSDTQVDGFGDRSCPTIVTFPTNPLWATGSLRLWNALDDNQRAVARSRDGLGLDQLSAAQVVAAKSALISIFWRGELSKNGLLLALCDSRAFSEARLFYVEHDAMVTQSSSTFESINNPSDDGRGKLVPGLSVFFAFGPTKPGVIGQSFFLVKR